MNSISELKKNDHKNFNLKTNIPNLILIIYIFVDLTRFFNVITTYVGNILYLLLGLLAIVYSIFKKGMGRQIPILRFIFIYTIFGALGILFNGNIDYQELLWPFAFIGLSTLFLNFNINYKLIRFLYYFILSFIVIKIIMVGGINNLEATTSRNTIGIMVLSYFGLHVISNYVNNKKITIYPVIFGLLTTVMAVGRSGILTFILLLILFIIFKFDGDKQKINNPFKWVLIVAFLGIILWASSNLLDSYYVETMRNFENRGLESVRVQIWHDYLNKTSTSIRYILFGTPIEGTFLLYEYSDNLHNSFLMLHAKYGLIILLIVISNIIKSLIFFLKKKNYLYSILLLAGLFRMQFDYTNFNAQLDIILFYLIFYRYFEKNRKNLN